MKFNGTHKFKAPSTQVFNAILNPEVLKECIPGCNLVQYMDASNILAEFTTQLPGLKGPFKITINIAQRQDPRSLELKVQQKSDKFGAVNAVSQINLTDEADGSLLSYDANAEFEGMVAMANNPLGQGAAKSALGAFFKNLDKTIS